MKANQNREAILSGREARAPVRSADILVRLFVLVNAQADRNVRAPKKVSCTA